MKPILPIILLSIITIATIPTTTSHNPDLTTTQKEATALAKLRPLVKDIKLDWLKSDWSLLHYLRAKSLDIKSSAAAVKETEKWRSDNNIDGILNEKIMDPTPPFDTRSRARDGSPLLLWAPARWDMRKYLLAGGRDKLVRYFDQMSESAFSVIREDQIQGRNTTQWVQILDLANYNLRQHACVTCFPLYFEWVAHWEKHFPAAHQVFYYVNTPRTFMPLLELLKGLYSPPTRDALKVKGSDRGEWSAELIELIEEDQLPKVWGGKRGSWP